METFQQHDIVKVTTEARNETVKLLDEMLDQIVKLQAENKRLKHGIWSSQELPETELLIKVAKFVQQWETKDQKSFNDFMDVDLAIELQKYFGNVLFDEQN